METCKNCKWWGATYPGACDKVGNNILMKNPQTFFDIDVRVADDWGLETYLKTGPDFGCVQFDAKTN